MANSNSYSNRYSQVYGSLGAAGVSSADSWPFHSFGGPNDVLIPKGDVCRRINDLLGQVTHLEGEYSFGGEAKVLPIMPGMALKDDEAFISLPLQKDNCENLLQHCSKDGEKLWTLSGDHVEFRNPEWNAGLEKLSEMSVARMGYKGVKMNIVLSEVMVIEKGSGLAFQRDSDENDRCVAKLVVQLPSRCSGGDVVVNEEGTMKQFRYTLGGNKGMKPYKPHYVVYTAGAYRTVEYVTSGYSLLLHYSLCLPPDLPFIRGSSGSDLLRMELAEAIMNLDKGKISDDAKGENVNFQNCDTAFVKEQNSIVSLILSKAWKLQDMTTACSDPQDAIDRARFAYLNSANAILPPEKQLRFYLACLQYVIPYYYGRWDQKKVEQCATWYTIRGEQLGDGIPIPVNWTTSFNFLNPGKETFDQLWKNGEGEFVYTYKRYAIVGWPSSEDIMNTHIFMGEIAAATSVFMDSPVDFSRLRALLKYGAIETPQQTANISALNNPYGNFATQFGQDQGNPTQHQGSAPAGKICVSLTCCQNLCKAISESEDVSLVSVFFEKYFSRLKHKRELIASLAGFVRKFAWGCVGILFVSALDRLPYSAGLGLALQLAEELADLPAVNATLTTIAVQKAGFAFSTCPEKLVSSSDVVLLWKHAMECSNPQVFNDVGNLFARLDAKIIGPVVEAFSKCVDGSSSPSHRVLLKTMVSRRRQWLLDQVAKAEKPFAWEIVDMNFVGAAGMAAFLQGPNTSHQVRCFKGLDDAHKRVTILHEKIRAPLKMTVGGRGRDAYVLVTKQAGKFSQKSQDIHKFKVEIRQLNHLLAVNANEIGVANNSVSVAANETTTSDVASSASLMKEDITSTATVTTPSVVGMKRPRNEPEIIIIE